MKALCVQKWDVCVSSYKEGDPYAEYVPLCQMWLSQLLHSSPNITILSMCLSAHQPPALWEFPLRHLDLCIQVGQPWLVECLEDLSHVTTLESLTMRFSTFGRPFGPLPDLHLESVRSLKHVKLLHLLPTETFSLPKGCQLHLHARCFDEWVKHSHAIEQDTSVLRLCGVGRKEWPARIQQFSNLQLLEIELLLVMNWNFVHPEPLDIADLRHIPHVRLHDHAGVMALKITAGFWQSLEISGVRGLTISDIDAFLKGTKSFTFDFSDDEESQRPLANICNACNNNGVHYYHCSATAISTSRRTVQAYTEHADGSCHCGSTSLSFCRSKRDKWLSDEGNVCPKTHVKL